MTTKEQERKALAQIKKIVDGLGEDSYIGIAFAGCFEVAEENIRNDFADSWKARAESARRQAGSLEITARDLKEERDRIMAARNVEASHAKAKMEAIQEQLTKAREKVLPSWLYREIWSHYDDEIEQLTAWMATHAETMATYAEHPQDIAFQNAVKQFRKCKAQKTTAEKVMAELEKLNPEK